MNRLIVPFSQQLYPVNSSGSSLSAGNTNSSSCFHFEVRHFSDPIGCRSIQTPPCVNSIRKLFKCKTTSSFREATERAGEITLSAPKPEVVLPQTAVLIARCPLYGFPEVQPLSLESGPSQTGELNRPPAY